MLEIALNQNTCNKLELIEFIEYSKDFKGIEINYEKIKQAISNKVFLQEIVELLDVYDLRTLSIFNLQDFSLCTDKDYKLTILPNLNLMTEYLYKLESDLLVVNPSLLDVSQDSRTIPKWRIINRTKKRLQQISKIALKYDINVGFEFLSMPNSSISTFLDAKEVIDELEAVENVGHVIDTFHFFTTNDNFELLNDIKERIFLIQLCDVKFLDNSKSSNNEELDRIFPGEGDFKLREFLDYSRKIGYRKMYSIELSEKCCKENIYDIIMNNLNKLEHR